MFNKRGSPWTSSLTPPPGLYSFKNCQNCKDARARCHPGSRTDIIEHCDNGLPALLFGSEHQLL